MKKIVVIIFVLFVSISAMAQQYTDYVYLKNGSIIKGVIEEQILGESLKIRTSDGSLFVFSMDQVEKITKERTAALPSYSGDMVMDLAQERPSWASADDLLEVSRFNDLSLNGKQLTPEETRLLLGKEYYDTFQSSYRQIQAGRTLLTVGLVGLGVSILSVVVAATSDYEEDMYSFLQIAVGTAAIADVSICLGCIFKGVGKGRRNWVIDSYNEDWRVHGRVASLQIEPALFRCESALPGQVANLGVGAALRIRF